MSSNHLRRPRLRFAPLAWLKLQYFCHRGETEVAGFGTTSPGHPLYIEGFVTLPQDCTSVTVALRDEAVADYFDRCVDEGLKPEQFARSWLHTHPGASVDPSTTDEETHARVFGGCDWSVMAILGRTGRTYARLSFNTGPKTDIEIETSVDWSAWPLVMEETGLSLDEHFDEWAQEYDAHIHPIPKKTDRRTTLLGQPFEELTWPAWDDWSWAEPRSET